MIDPIFFNKQGILGWKVDGLLMSNFIMISDIIMIIQIQQSIILWYEILSKIEIRR